LRIRYTLPALADLDAILDYLAVRSPQGAARVQARIKSLIDLLPTHPLIGARTDDPTDPAFGRCAITLSGVLRSSRRRAYHSQHSSFRPQSLIDSMKLHYYAETDSLYIERRATERRDSRGRRGRQYRSRRHGAIVGLDIDGAPRKLDLTTIETVALPVKAARAA
jgi:plasmid stabilization system protein ParE